MLLAQTKRRVGIVQAVLRFSLALKGKRLVSPEEKTDKKKIFFWKYVSCGGETVLCVRCFFFFFFLGCCSLDPCWKHALVEKTDKCPAAFYWSSSYTKSEGTNNELSALSLWCGSVMLAWLFSSFLISFADYDNTRHCYNF